MFYNFSGAVNNQTSPTKVDQPFTVEGWNIEHYKGSLVPTREDRYIGNAGLPYRYEYKIRGESCTVQDSYPLATAVYNHNIYSARYNGSPIAVSNCKCSKSFNSLIIENRGSMTVSTPNNSLTQGRVLNQYTFEMLRAGLSSILAVLPADLTITYNNTNVTAKTFIEDTQDILKSVEDSTDKNEQLRLYNEAEKRIFTIQSAYKNYTSSDTGVTEKNETVVKFENQYKETEKACYNLLYSGNVGSVNQDKVITTNYYNFFEGMRLTNNDLITRKWDSSSTFAEHIAVENNRIQSDPVMSNSQKAYDWRKLFTEVYDRLKQELPNEAKAVNDATDYIGDKLEEYRAEARKVIDSNTFQHSFTMTQYNSCIGVESAPITDVAYYGTLSDELTFDLLEINNEVDKVRFYYNPPDTANYYLIGEVDARDASGNRITKATITLDTTDPFEMIGLPQLSTRGKLNKDFIDVVGLDIVKGILFFFRRSDDTRLYYSKQGQPDYISNLQFLAFERGIVHIERIQNSLLVFDGYNNYTVSTDGTFTVKRVDSDSYLRAPTTVVARYANVMWLHYQGLKIQMGFGSQSLTHAFWDRYTIPTDIDPTAWSSALWKDSYWLLHVPTDTLYEFNLKTRTLHLHKANKGYVHIYAYEDKLYATTRNGALYALFDDEAYKSFYLRTGTFTGYRADVWLEFLTYAISQEFLNEKGKLKVKAFIDQRLVLEQEHPTEKYKAQHKDDKVVAERVPFPTRGNKGSNIYIEFRGTDVILNSLTLFYTTHQYEY